MSNLVPFKGQKIAKVFSGIDHGPALGENVQQGFSAIGYRGKQWSLRHAGHTYNFVRPDDGSPLTYLDLIIVAQQPAISKAYFPGVFSEDNASGPICYSTKGDKPDPGVSIPQSKTCPSCPHWGWTTLPNGNRGKECQDHQRLAVLPVPALTKKMLGSPLLEPVFFKVPPGSLQALKAYGSELKDEGFPPFAVVTRVSFHPEKLFQMQFEGVKVLTDQEAAYIKPMLDSPVTRRIIGTATEIHETQPMVASEKVDTGLIDAFTGNGNGRDSATPSEPKPAPVQEISNPAPAPKRGRPKAAVQEAKVVQDAAPAEDEANWDESDSQTDKEIDKTLGTALGDMFK